MWSGATDEKSTLEDCCQQNLAANGTMGLEYVYNAVHIILPPSISSDSAIHTDVLHSIVSSIFEFGVGTRSRHLSVVNTLPHHLTWQAQNFCLHWNKTPHIPHFHLLIVKCCILIVNCNSPLDLASVEQFTFACSKAEHYKQCSALTPEYLMAGFVKILSFSEI